MEERKIGSGTSCFLVKDESLKLEWHAPLYEWLRNEGFVSWGRKGTFLGVDWIYINITSKVFASGMPGVGITPVIGNHAITLEEFMTIYEFYKKYEGLGPLQMTEEEQKNGIRGGQNAKDQRID